MSVTCIAVVVLIAAVLAGCAVGDGPARQDAYPAPGGAPTEQTRSRALQRAGDLPAGYDTLDREVLTASDRDWGDPWGDEGWGDDGCRWLLEGATSPVEPTGRAWGPGRPGSHGAAST